MFSDANECSQLAVGRWFATAENTWQPQKATIMPGRAVWLAIIKLPSITNGYL
jgi:hypothetical protein